MDNNQHGTSVENSDLPLEYYASLVADMLEEAALVDRGFIPEQYGLGLSTIEILHEAGVKPLDITRKPRAKAQCPVEISRLKDAASDRLVELTAVELQAGPTARLKIESTKRFQAAPGLHADRVSVKNQRLGQRNALARVMQVQFHTDVVTTLNEKSREYLDILTALSANVAVLSGTGWIEAQTWMNRNIPALFILAGAGNVKACFDGHFHKACHALATKANIHRKDCMTGPSAKEIAHRLEITTDQLRVAKANKVGLTSIDTEDARTRDVKAKAEKRLAAGMKPQGERTLTAETEALAQLAGCNEKTIRRHRDKGDLAEYLSKRGVVVQKVALAKDIYQTPEIGHSPEAEQTIDLEQNFSEHDHAKHIGDDATAFPLPWNGSDDWTLAIGSEGEACYAVADGRG